MLRPSAPDLMVYLHRAPMICEPDGTGLLPSLVK